MFCLFKVGHPSSRKFAGLAHRPVLTVEIWRKHAVTGRCHFTAKMSTWNFVSSHLEVKFFPDASTTPLTHLVLRTVRSTRIKPLHQFSAHDTLKCLQIMKTTPPLQYGWAAMPGTLNQTMLLSWAQGRKRKFPVVHVCLADVQLHSVAFPTPRFTMVGTLDVPFMPYAESIHF
jgi:hypothetical protein